MLASEIDPVAEAELNEIATFFESRTPGFGSNFIADFERAVLHIRQFPKGTPIRRNKLRHVLIGRSRVYLVYKLHRDRVHVYRLIHASINPKLRYK